MTEPRSYYEIAMLIRSETKKFADEYFEFKKKEFDKYIEDKIKELDIGKTA